MAERKIVQIMAAPGWAASFEDQGEEMLAPLVGWALLDDGAVVGLVARERVELADGQPNFLGYTFVEDIFFDEPFDGEDPGFDDGLEDDEPPSGHTRGRLN